jgi:predicted O-methyltransferase YrrM
MKESPNYIGHMVMHHHHLVKTWSQMDQAVKTGKPLRKKVLRDDEELESFLMGMYNLAMGIAPRLAGQVDLLGRNRLLDLGGGPGTYAIHFCLANPELRATVYDLPSSRPFAIKTIDKFGLADRVEFMEGDYLESEGDFGGTYDVAWLSHILHAEGPDACQMIIDKVASALEPGGLLLVHDFIMEDTFDGPFFPALFSLNMLANTEKGQSYSGHQIKEMLAKAGLKNIQRLTFKGPNESGIISGVL